MFHAGIKAILSVAVLLGATVPHAEAKGLTIQCNDSTEVQMRELFSESSYRYPYGDLIEVRISNPRTGPADGKYRLAAAGTGSFGGRWVYVGPPGRSFSLLLSGKAPVWYLDVEGQKPVTCARV